MRILDFASSINTIGLMSTLYRNLFWLMTWLGRPLGGLPPRRFTNWLARRAFGDLVPVNSEFRWHRDQFGNEFLLHPYFLIDCHVIAFGAYEPGVAAVIRDRVGSGMVGLDVGANIGLFSVLMGRLVGRNGTIHCFEPVPENLARLRANVDRNGLQGNVLIHPVALSNANEVATLNMNEISDINQGMGSLVSTQNILRRKLSVSTQTLDSFSATHHISRLDFIKVDIQGAEPLFLEGAHHSLARWRPIIVMEISSPELAALGKTPADLVEQIESVDYCVYTTKHGRPDRLLRPHQVSDDACLTVLCLPS